MRFYFFAFATFFSSVNSRVTPLANPPLRNIFIKEEKWIIGVLGCGLSLFFAVNFLERKVNDLLMRHIDILRVAVAKLKIKYPFVIHGWVVLPNHIHCVIELLAGDSDFAVRWRLIKILFSRGLPLKEYRSAILVHRKERGIWQRRYWEHLIRNQRDFENHMNYIHYNPVKQGLVSKVSDWPFSTSHHLAKRGVYPKIGVTTDLCDEVFFGGGRCITLRFKYIPRNSY